MFNKRKRNEEYIAPLDLLDILPEPVLFNNDKEVMFTIGDQQVIRNEDKYYLANGLDFSQKREITREAAYELAQIQKQQNKNEPRMFID